MFDNNALTAIIAAYKKDFARIHREENYKWKAVKCFQDNWDINAPDFLEMFMKATEKTANLLASRNNFPRGMIREFIEADAEAVRTMFTNLFDENRDLIERIEKFQSDADIMQEKYNNGTWKQHFQNSNSISTYLWLRYPDKYYIYKYSEVRAVAKQLSSNFVPKKGASSANITGAFDLYNEMCSYISEDTELASMLKEALTDNCYSDDKLKTLTIDIGFYISRHYTDNDTDTSVEWFPADYSPNITTEKWVELLNNPQVFTKSSKEIMKRIKDYGGMATCTQLSIKYGETKNFYNSGSSSLAKRVADTTGCPVMKKDTENSKWWPILYVGRYSDKDMDGNYIWKLRDELNAALDRIDMSDVQLYAERAEGNYWWLNANPKIWSFSGIRVGEEQSYTLLNENGNKRRIYQNFLDAKAGDLVIGYESTPVKQIVALCKISRENDGNSLYFEKVEGLSAPIEYSAIKDIQELQSMEYLVNPQGSLFKLTKNEYDLLLDIIREQNPISPPPLRDDYSKQYFLSQVYLSEEDYDSLVSLLEHKKNVILQGAPGVGKTFAAKRLAYSMLGKKDDDKIKIVQFHQSYSYEDFIMGYKPDETGFKLQTGIFYQFCQQAENHPNDKYFFIIDEINRGNLSKIFGELLMMIEKDYRGEKMTMAYSGLSFSVPENLYIIGMMNTADRSLAMIDYALRRRFSFFDMRPAFYSEGFTAYQRSLNNEILDDLIEVVKKLNQDIANDASLGEGFCIGHSYFCEQSECTEEWISEVIEYDLIPMLDEYWFDDKAKAQMWARRLRGVLND